MGPRLRRLLGATVGRFPVRVRSGIAQGARWTLFPWTSYWRGAHEPQVQAAVCGLGGGDIRGWSCWDLGAHFGIYSVGLAMRAGPGGQVAALEPNPESFARLELHRRMNALGWLRTYRAAAAARTGTAELLTYGDLGSMTTHLPYPDETVGAGAAPLPVRTLSLDDEVDAGRLRAPQFVKIDVEGSAHGALLGMARSLAASRPVLLVALHDDSEALGVLSVLDPLGYDRAPVAPQRAGAPMAGADFWFTPRPRA